MKVGRAALDSDAMRRLEEQYPDVTFDWNRILREPPQTLPEHEATRRKEQRDARDARRKRKRSAVEEQASGFRAQASGKTPEADELAGATDDDGEAGEDSESSLDVLTPGAPRPAASAAGGGSSAPAGAGERRRKRRRRGRGKAPGGAPPAGSPPTDSV